MKKQLLILTLAALNSEKPSNNVRIPAPTIAEGSIINTL